MKSSKPSNTAPWIVGYHPESDDLFVMHESKISLTEWGFIHVMGEHEYEHDARDHRALILANRTIESANANKEQSNIMAKKTETAAPTTNKWQALLDQMAEKSGGNGVVFFPKKGKTRIRLVPIQGTEDTFFAETKAVFRGKARTKYLLSAFVIATDQGELNERWVNKQVAVLVPVAVLKGILGLLADGYDLLSEEGHGVTISKTGGGLETAYAVMPSQKPVEIPEGLIYLEQSFEEIAEEYANRADSADDSDDEPPARRGAAQETSGGDW